MTTKTTDTHELVYPDPLDFLAVLVPLSVPKAEREAWARGYVAAKRDFRRFEKNVPRTCDDVPTVRQDGLLTERGQEPRS